MAVVNERVGERAWMKVEGSGRCGGHGREVVGTGWEVWS